MRKLTLIALFAVLVAPMAFAGSAATTGTDNITASVANKCTIANFGIAFGPYDPIVTNAVAAVTNNTQSLSVFCTKDATISVVLSAASGSVMSNGAGGALNYTVLFSNGTNTAAGTGLGKASAVAGLGLNGTIPGGQDVPAGSYKDTMVATVNF